MKVNVVECLAGARRARGVAVVIDVFRSCSVACYAIDQGVTKYLAAETLEQARDLAAANQGQVIGEKRGMAVDDFDYYNSPTLIEGVDFTGKTLVHTTNSGMPGLHACADADEVLTGSFVNAGAVIRYLSRRNPEEVTLVAMGTNGEMRAQEDMMCAMYIKNELEEYPNSFKTLKSFLAGVDSAEKFFDEAREDAPEQDFELCMALDRFDFVLCAEPVSGGGMELKKINVESDESV